MNVFDILVAIVAAWAIFSGWRRGLAAQILSIAALIIAIILGARFGYRTGEIMKVSAQLRTPVGFAVVFAAAFIAVSLISKLFQKIIKGIGMNGMDIVLGISLALAKAFAILCIAFTSFDAVNRSHDLVEKSYLDSSICYGRICRASDTLMPFITKARDSVKDGYLGKEGGK